VICPVAAFVKVYVVPELLTELIAYESAVVLVYETSLSAAEAGAATTVMFGSIVWMSPAMLAAL
jgi:hypothetical protein